MMHETTAWRRMDHADAPDTAITALLRAARNREKGHTYLGANGPARSTYGQLLDSSLEVASGLCAAGVKPGDRVTISLRRPEQFVASFLGAIVAGAVPTPLMPLSEAASRSRLETAASILSVTRSTLVIGDEQSILALGSTQRRVSGVPRIATVEELKRSAGARVELPAPSEGDIAFLQFTSGSSAAPKGIAVTHGCLMANARGQIESLGYDMERDVCVSWLPFHHDMGLVGFLIAPLVAGMDAVFLPTESFVRNPAGWFDAIHRYRGTVTFAPNFAFALALRRLRHEVHRNWDLSCLRILGCGAEPIDAATLEEFSNVFTQRFRLPETAISPAYGMAEATLAMTVADPHSRLRVDDVDAAVLSATGRAVPVSADPGARTRRIVSCGRPLPRHEVRILRDGADAPERCEGEITFRGPSVTPGYFENPEATAGVYRDGWLLTGDLGYIADGELFVSGRKKDVIICHGVKYHASDIESVASAVPGVRYGGIAAVASEDPGSGGAVLVVEGPRSSSATLRHDISSHVTQELGIPVADVVVVAPGALPKTSSGKLQRARVRRWYAALDAAHDDTPGDSARDI